MQQYHSDYGRLCYWLCLGLLLASFGPLSAQQPASKVSKHPYTAQAQHKCSYLKRAQGSKGSNPMVSPAHQRRMRRYDVSYYKLDLQLTRSNNDLAGNVLIEAQTEAQPLDTFAFELDTTLTIDSIHVNGTPSSGTLLRDSGAVNLLLQQGIGANERFGVRIFYHGSPRDASPNTGVSGLSTITSANWGSRVTFSLSQPYSAYEWWPCKQLLGDKADSSTVWVTTDSSNQVGANGLLRGVDTLSGGQLRYRWHSDYPINYYLISVAVSDYEEYSFKTQLPGSQDSLLVQNYLYPNARSFFKEQIDSTADLLRLFSRQFGPYPFAREKYGHAMAPFGGGMEHQTLTTQSYFVLWLTAHELAHQWFGNNVTCARWEDLFLNEGFATYAEYLAYEAFFPDSAHIRLRMMHENVLGGNQGSVYVEPIQDEERLFSSRLTYDKGGAIIHTLRHEINNDSLFFDILQQYQRDYADSVAGLEDFRAVVEAQTDSSWQGFFDQWYYSEGHPMFDMSWNAAHDSFYLRVFQTMSAGSEGPAHYDVTLPFRLKRPQGDTLIRLWTDEVAEDLAARVPGPVQAVEFAPNYEVLHEMLSLERDSDLVVVTNRPQHTPPKGGDPIRIGPNPTEGRLNYHTPQLAPNARIQLYNTQGQQLRSLRLHHKHGQINWTDLSAGLYLLRLRNGQHQQTQRIILR